MEEVNGRQYISVTEIARFYRLEAQQPSPDSPSRRRFANGKHALELAPGRRAIEVNGVLHWLSFPVLQRGGGLLITRLDLVKTVEPALRPRFIPGLAPVETIVLDPGHGGHDLGATSSYGYEKDFALDVAKHVRDILRQQGKIVIMTRDDDTFVELIDRAKIANRASSAIFVSIHFNATRFNDEANGFEVFCLSPQGGPSTMDQGYQARFAQTHPGNAYDNASLALSTAIYHSILAHMNRRDRGVKRQRFAVLKHARMPSCLIECGFLNGRRESRVVATSKWRERLAHAIARGINAYVELAETREPLRVLSDYTGASEATFEQVDGQLTLQPNTPQVIVPGGQREPGE
jgi:N-acetylmuramoyl-L-alanine amidase